MKFKIPSFEKPLAKLKSFRWQAKPKAISRERMPVRRQAAMRRAAQDFDEMDEPTTKLSSAFIVVLILHIVAVAGIYAFNSIKAHRKSREVPVAVAERPSTRSNSSSTENVSQPIASSAAARSASYAPAVPTQKVYKAHGGETISRVAALNGVSASELAQLNGLREAAILKPDQTIVIPPSKSAKAAAAASASADAKKAEFLAAKAEDAAFVKPNATTKPAATATKPATTSKAGTAKTYVVAKGDTLTSIAKKNSVTVEELMKANDIKDAKKLQPAQSLKIPAKKSE